MAHVITLSKAYSANTGAANTYSWSGSFDVFKETEVIVELDGTALTYTATTINESASPRQYSVNLSGKTIHIGGADLSSGTIKIYPRTDLGSPTARATFSAGSSVTASDLNANQTQVLRKVMEVDAELGEIAGDHWNVTTETLASSETFVDSDSYIMTAAAIQDRIDATSPALVDTTKVAKAGDTMTGNLIIDNAKEIRFSEPDASGSNYTAFKAQAQGSDITLTLPAAAPGTGKYLKTNDSTATTLEWGDAGVGATGGGDDIVFWVNEQTVDHDYTIPNNRNAGSFGPITVQSGKTVTVGAGEYWTVV